MNLERFCSKKIQMVVAGVFCFYCLSPSLSMANQENIPSSSQNQPETTVEKALQDTDFKQSTSSDFLMNDRLALFSLDENPLSPAENTNNDPTQDAELSDQASKQVVMDPVLKETEELTVIMLGESCEERMSGTFCIRQFSDESTNEILKQSKQRGDEFRQLTTITSFDGRRTPQHRKVIYQGKQEAEWEGHTTKEFEFYEILEQPRDGADTKEILIFDYYPESGNTRKITWGKYELLNPQDSPVLVAHATLNYDRSGKPEKGLAVSSDYEEQSIQFLNWDREQDAQNNVQQSSWSSWESWLTNRQLSVYLS